jgi:competence protein ComEA
MEDVPRPAPATRGEVFLASLRRWRSDARVGLALLLCVAVAAGVAWFRAGVAPSPPSTADRSTSDATSRARAAGAAPTTSSSTTSTIDAALVVDVVGAVRAAGVVTLTAGARVVDAVTAAGGAVPGADLSRLNLAAPLVDGMRIAVPMLGRPAPAVDPAAISGATTGASAAPGAPGGQRPLQGPVDVNTATAEQLDVLPGVGPATAQAIVAEREAHGPFESVDDLDRVKGIGPSKLEQLRDLVTV